MIGEIDMTAEERREIEIKIYRQIRETKKRYGRLVDEIDFCDFAIAENIFDNILKEGIEKMGGVICSDCRKIVLTPKQCIDRYSKKREV